jgi:hypothetical protein
MITLRDGNGHVLARATVRDTRSLVWLPQGGSFEVDGAGVVSGDRSDAVAAPTRHLLMPAAMLAQGFAAMHASAVEVDGRAAVFAGVSGAGKSTTAAALASRGHRYLADDFVGLDPASDGPACVAPPACPRLLEASRSRLGPLRRIGSDATTRAGVGAIFVLEPDASIERPSIEVVRPSAAFPLLMAHAHDAAWDDIERKRRDVAFFLRLASRVTTLRLRFAHVFEHLEDLLDRVQTAMATCS